MKNLNEENDEGHVLEIDVQVQYPEKLRELHNGLSFLPERMKIEKVKKLVANLDDKTEYVIHIRNLKQALNLEIVLKNCIELLNLNKMLN